MKTERLTILVSANEKEAITAQAKVLNIIASEVVRMRDEIKRVSEQIKELAIDVRDIDRRSY